MALHQRSRILPLPRAETGRFIPPTELPGQQRRHLADTLGVLAGVVVAELGGDRQPLDDLDLRLDQLARPLTDLRFEQLVLTLNLDVEQPRLEQRFDPQQQLVLRLLSSVANIDSQRLRTGFLEEMDFTRLAPAMTITSTTG